MAKTQSENEKGVAAAARSAWLGDLLQIIERADKRSLQVNIESNVRWLVELPMTDEEYKRWVEITGWHEK